MDHRDRGRGELARQKWQDSGGRSDPATPWPTDPYSRPDVTYRTPSRSRARHRGAPEPVDSYTPSWAREATEPLQSSASQGYADTSAWAADSPSEGRDGGRHHRFDAPAEPAGEGGRAGGRRRIAPEVTWDSTGEYWRSSSGVPADTSGDESSDDRWGLTAGTAGTAGWRRAEPTAGPRDEVTEPGATGGGGRRRRRAGAEGRSGESDDWAAAAPTSGWVGAAPTSGWVGAAPTTGGAPTSGWISEAPTSGGWAAAAPTTGAGANSGLYGEAATTPRRGRRRRADPDDEPTGLPTSGWGVGAADSRSAGTGRHDGVGGVTGWRERVDEPGSGRWGGAGEPEVGGGYGSAQGTPGRRRRAEPAGAEHDDLAGGGVPSAGRRRSRHRAGEDPTEVTEQPEAVPPAGPDPETGGARATARWVRSPTENAPVSGAGRRSRRSDPPRGSTGTGTGAGAGAGTGRRHRAPDAEPVRRYREAGPVRRAGEERGRHADPAPEPSWDGFRAGGGTDAGPWDRLTDTGMLDPVPDVESPTGPGTGRRRDRSTETGQWERDRFTDTGQWDRFTDTTEWRHGELAGLARDTSGGRDTPVDSGFRDSDRAGPADGDTFWSGTRLAGDDPRWMGIPDSAPRSPAVAYPPPARPVSPARRPRVSEPTSPAAPVRRPATAPGRGRAGPVGSPRGAGGAGTTTRRAPGGSLLTSATRTGRPSPLSRRLEDDLLDPQPSGPLTAVLYTAAWYAVAVLAVFVWVLTLDASVPVDCVAGVAGSCESERAQAISALLAGVPRFLAALATGLVVAALMRWFNRSWRAVTIGLSAAVVGGGLSTVFFSAISGQPIG